MSDREKLYEAYLELIKESLEWAEDSPSYYNYINGATDMINVLLKKETIEDNKEK